jgi:hypothetical protein
MARLPATLSLNTMGSGLLILALALLPTSGYADWPSPGYDRGNTRAAPGKGAITGQAGSVPGVVWSQMLAGSVQTSGIRLSDVNGDDKPELLLLSQGQLTVTDLDGNVLWAGEPLSIDNIYGVYDLNGNGNLEIVATSSSSAGQLLIYDGKSGSLLHSEPATWLSTSWHQREYVVTNIDADPEPEIIWSSHGNSTYDLNVLEYDPNTNGYSSTAGSFKKVQGTSMYSNATPVLAGPLEAGGSPHVIFNSYVHLMSWDASTKDTDAATVYANVFPHHMFGVSMLIDVDDDGVNEYITFGYGSTYQQGIWVFDPNALEKGETTQVTKWACKLGKATDFSPSLLSNYAYGVPTDLDGTDTTPELVISFIGGGTSPNTDGLCPDGSSFSVNGDTYTLHIVDLNTGAIQATLPEAKPIGQADMDGDGSPEIIVRSDTDGSYAIYSFKGGNLTKVASLGTTHVPQTEYVFPRRPSHSTTSSNPPRELMVADVNGDSKQEILVKTSGKLTWLNLENGAVVEVTQANKGAGNFFGSWTSSTGDIYLLATNGTSAYIVGPDMTVMDAITSPFVKYSARSIMAADLDGDGSAVEITYNNGVYEIDPTAATPLTKRYQATGGLPFRYITDTAGSVLPKTSPAIISANDDKVIATDGVGNTLWTFEVATNYSDYRIADDKTLPGVFTNTSSTDIAVILDHKKDKTDRKLVVLSWDGTASTPNALGPVDIYRKGSLGFYTSPYYGYLHAADLGQVGAWGSPDGIEDLYVRSDDGMTSIIDVLTGTELVPSFQVKTTWPGNQTFADIDGDGAPEILFVRYGSSSNSVAQLAYELGPEALGSTTYDAQTALSKVWTSYMANCASVKTIYTLVDTDGGGVDIFYMDGLGGFWRLDGSTGTVLSGYPVYLNGGQLSADMPSSFRPILDVLSHDIDGDGSTDVLAGSSDGWLYSVGFDANAAPTLKWSLYLGVPIYQVIPADYNGDGVDELVVSGKNGTLYGIGPQATQLVMTTPKTTDAPITSAVTVSGTMVGGTEVQIYLNGALVETATVAGSNWTASITVPEGTSQILAVGLDTDGSEVAQASVGITYWDDYDADGLDNASDCPEIGGHLDDEINPNHAELCDNKDNDCSGSVDDGAADSDCDDGLSCTTNTCDGAGTCETAMVDDYCLLDTDNCVASGDTNPDNSCVICDTSKSITDWSNNDGVACDDGDVCTLSDTCSSGVCVSGDQDTCDDANSCTDDSCTTLVGCDNVNSTDGCDDANACTTGDTCSAGLCAGTDTSATDCNDSNGCTDDSCDTGTGCVNTNNADSCDDSNACTAGDFCGKGVCAGVDTSATDCNDGNGCTDDICDPGTGCAQANNTSACNDANACTTADTCTDGACVGGVAPDCDDGNACTLDNCDTVVGCVSVNQSGDCDDGILCTSGDSCAGGVCSGTAYTCADCETCAGDGGCTVNEDKCRIDDACYETDDINAGNACMACDPAADPTAWSPLSGGECDDSDPCTATDVCTNGTCGGETIAGACKADGDCANSNPCTAASCDVAACACVTDSSSLEGQLCDDDDPCTGGGTCEAGECVVPADICASENLCTQGTCTDEGCVFGPVECEAGRMCNEGDCVDVQCAACEADEDCGDSAVCELSQTGANGCMWRCETQDDCREDESCETGPGEAMRCVASDCLPAEEPGDDVGADAGAETPPGGDAAEAAEPQEGCSCRLTARPQRSSNGLPVAFALLALIAVYWRRRSEVDAR